MDRTRLDDMTLEQARREAAILEIDISGTRDQILERIIDHYARNGPSGLNSDSNNHTGILSVSNSITPSTSTLHASNSSFASKTIQTGEGVPLHSSVPVTETNHQNLPSNALANFATIMQMHFEKQRRFQDDLMNMIRGLSNTNSTRITGDNLSSGDRIDATQTMNAPPLLRTTTDMSTSSGHFVGQNVKLLAAQIPEFGGTVRENVSKWIERVDWLSNVYQAPDDIILIAAVSKLVKEARRWYDRQPPTIIHAWL